ncbi:ABC transporter substrate-binding protein [Rhodobacter capsulatus]|uniref:Ferrichrome ABC transporter, periplasmic ferrichrome-binding protein FhuD-2 n=1 Tax=Rhodobacter capsulatus (strain ATCC BAA-309 / NBRC 16581 / SB1003) TaxID=272942 RepID=D5AVN1_RHOCB|nr:ABC transporter substrate-binding protein [Rhodobacter capsulatus]ADE87366.1 ferrichrome ABC transporter, periplasmic ferrichrome-binding protein FhuD-2 [Rhodobacter capsulatus SB 1003]ETE52118.1 amino acid ABC transporter substrate-binding protein [Rhodobacter capsulatus Y262]MDS0927583.1 ABC transporter substrate-binding protein [Rhodobacter capsulatus]
MTRRAVLVAAASAVVAGRAGAGEGAAAVRPLRLAAIDWAMAETAAALGHPPQALAELAAFRRTAPMPLSADTIDLGLRGGPSLETLALAAPDLILSSSYYSFAEARLAGIAPVFSRPLFVPGVPPLPRLIAATQDLATRLGTPAAASAVLSRSRAEFAALARRIPQTAAAPCLLVEIGDARHVRLFGTDSLFHGALTALGLTNAWDGESRFAFAAPVPLERLADFPTARIVLTGEIPVQTARGLARSELWNALPARRAGRVSALGAINGFGGLPSALRFARALTKALEAA